MTDQASLFDNLDRDQFWAADTDVPDVQDLPSDFWDRRMVVVKVTGGRL